MERLTFGSLFAGIGGFDLGFERAGFVCKWQVEIDEYCQKVLSKHWPAVQRHRDVKNVGKRNLESVDAIIGGFPCQPHSLAGKRLSSSDSRDLWGEMFRVICEIRPRWIVAENVRGLLSSENGRYFGRVLRDLASAGYDAEWHIIRATDAGAPHKRERVFIIAYPHRFGLETDANKDGLCKPPVMQISPRRFSEMGFERQWDSPRPIGARTMGMGNGVPSDVHRIKGLGNAVVPQVAEYVARQLLTLDGESF